MRQLFPADCDLIDLMERLPVIPTLRTLVKARQWRQSRHLDLAEELLDECGVPQAVRQLAEIMETKTEREWCSAYVAATGLTDRTYRRHKLLAEQIITCRKSATECPNVHEPEIEMLDGSPRQLRLVGVDAVGGQTDM